MSLLEVQLAMMLLLVAALTALAVAPTGLRSAQHAQDASLTASYARHLMESTMALQFSHQSSVPPAPGTFNDVNTIFPSAPAGIYTYRIDVSPLSYDPRTGAAYAGGVTNPEVHCIQVTVNWRNQNANGTTGTHTVRLVGYSAKTK